MHVLFFLPNLRSYRDRVRLLMEVSKGLDRLTFLVGLKNAEISLEGYDRFRLVEVGFKQGNRPYNVWKANKLAERIISRENVNIVHDTFGTFLPLFYKKKRYPQVRFVTSLFGPSGYRLRHSFNKVNLLKLLSNRSTAVMFFNQWIEKQICSLAEHVVLQAPGLMDHLLEYVPILRTKIHIITNNVDTEFWCPENSSGHNTKNANITKLLFVGGIDYTRGIFTLIEVMSHLLKEKHRCVLKVVGGWGPFAKKKVIADIQARGLSDVIEFFPKISNMELRDIFRSSDLFLYQTINDGSPRIVLEAMATGLPIIASRHPGIEVLDPKGEFIAFTEFGDVGRIVALIQDYKKQQIKWVEKRRQGREVAVSMFASSIVAKQYISFYEKIVNLSIT